MPDVDLDGLALLDLVVVDHDGLQDDVDDSACDEVCHDEVDSDDDQMSLLMLLEMLFLMFSQMCR